MHCVYKYVYNDEIIYIGKTDISIIKRLSQHGKSGDNIDEKYWNQINNSKIYYCKLANKCMCDVVESELIRRYKPKLNKDKKSEWSGLNFVEPEWYYFDKELYNNIVRRNIYLENIVHEFNNNKKTMKDTIYKQLEFDLQQEKHVRKAGRKIDERTRIKITNKIQNLNSNAYITRKHIDYHGDDKMLKTICYELLDELTYLKTDKNGRHRFYRK